MNRKLLVLVALGLPLAACHKAPAADNGAFNEDAATFNEAAAMNTSVVATPPADNATADANAAAPADANSAAPAPAKP
jgi:hypothetical protein